MSSSFLPLKSSNWSAQLNPHIGTFPDYQALPYHVGTPARSTHGIMPNVRNSQWEFEQEYVFEGVLPILILFVAIGILLLIVLPIWLCMYKRGKLPGCCQCFPHYTLSKRAVGICLAFNLILALICILMAISGAAKIHEGMNDASEQTCLASLLLSIGEQVIHQLIIFQKSLARISQHNIAARSEVNH